MVSSRQRSRLLRVINSSAMQTMDDESIPPLSSAVTGASARSRLRIDAAKTWRKRSSYSSSVAHRTQCDGSNRQYSRQVARLFLTGTYDAGGTESISA